MSDVEEIPHVMSFKIPRIDIIILFIHSFAEFLRYNAMLLMKEVIN